MQCLLFPMIVVAVYFPVKLFLLDIFPFLSFRLEEQKRGGSIVEL